MKLQGSMVAIVTPLRDGVPDLQSLRELADWHVLEGTDGIVPCGTTGEGATLTVRERADVIRTVVEAARGRVKVIAGAGSNSTAEAIEGVKLAKELRADAALVVTPYYNKPTQEGLYRHYMAIWDAVGFPVVAYNVPSRTAVDMLPETVARLAQLPNIVGIKEATGDLNQGAKVVRLCPENFIVLSGDDALTLPVMAVGGRGVISVASNEMPTEMAGLVELAESGDFRAAATSSFMARGATFPITEITPWPPQAM
jgi:4-hydroxy-tetrahydrodipicolinate synthase